MVRGGAAPSTLRFDYDARGALWRTSDSERGTTLQLGDGFEARVGGGYRVSVALPGMRCVLPGGFQAAACSFSDTNGVSLTYNAAGALVGERGYEPYGREIRAAGPGPVPPWGYEDKRRHDHGRLLDFGARPYDPLARQFLSVDPLRLDGAGDVLASGNTLQPFVYAAANPIANWDPDGRQSFKCWWSQHKFWLVPVTAVVTALVVAAATGGFAAAPAASGATAVLATKWGIAVKVGLTFSTALSGAGEFAAWASGPDTIADASGREFPRPPANPEESPGEGWEWRGDGPVGSERGSWVNPKEGKLHPDLDHLPPVGPHWDYRAPDGTDWRIFNDGRVERK